MDSTLRPRRTLALTVLTTIALALGLTLAAPVVAPAQADQNQGEGPCIMGYNYADPGSGTLYAGTTGKGGCTSVVVNIYNNATLVGGSVFEGSYCTATQTWASLASSQGFVGVYAYRHVSLWQTPCSGHYGNDGMHTSAHAGLYFLCGHSNCWQPSPPKQ